MAKFPLYQWKKAGEGTSSIDTQNFASKIKANTFTETNTFNATTTFGGETTFNANVRVENGNTAGLYASKDITNDNDNQVINYKAFYWKRVHEQNSVTVNATNGIQAYDITTQDLTRYKHIKVMLRFTPNNYDYTVMFDLTCNNLSYKNQGEVKFIHWGDNTVSTLAVEALLCVSVAQYGGNKLRVNIRNIGTTNITTGKIYTYIQMVKPNFQR